MSSVFGNMTTLPFFVTGTVARKEEGNVIVGREIYQIGLATIMLEFGQRSQSSSFS